MSDSVSERANTRVFNGALSHSARLSNTRARAAKLTRMMHKRSKVTICSIALRRGAARLLARSIQVFCAACFNCRSLGSCLRVKTAPAGVRCDALRVSHGRSRAARRRSERRTEKLEEETFTKDGETGSRSLTRWRPAITRNVSQMLGRMPQRLSSDGWRHVQGRRVEAAASSPSYR